MRYPFLQAFAISCGLALGACSSSAPQAAGSPTPTVDAQSSSATVAALTETSAVATPTGQSSADPGPICDTIPTLEVISAAVGETMTNFQDTSQPTLTIGGDVTIAQRCDVSGDGFAIVQFERWDLKQGRYNLEPTEDFPDLIQDISFPDLPGAVAWANNVVIEHDGLYYVVFAAPPSAVGVDNAPEVYAAGAALLKSWIGA